MICNVVFKVGNDLSIFTSIYPKDKSKNQFLEFALLKLVDLYTHQFSYMFLHIDSISKNINNETVTIIGYFDDKFNYFSSSEFYHFEFNDLDCFKALKSKLDEKFHLVDLKRSDVKFAKDNNCNIVSLKSDNDVKEYVKSMKGVKNEVQKN